MKDWTTINKAFEKWLDQYPELSGVKRNSEDKDFAAVKYHDAFKLFIAKYDGDDDLNMDSFSKSTKAEEKDKDKDNTLLKDMMSDYVDSLKGSDKAFDAIDGIDGSRKDGKISNAEKRMFVEKVAVGSTDFDGKVDNFSFDDVIRSVKKIEDGDTEFLNVDVQIPDEVEEVQEVQNVDAVEKVDATQPLSSVLQANSDEVTGLQSVLNKWSPYEPREIKAMDFVKIECSGEGEGTPFSLDSVKGSQKIKLEISCAIASKNMYAEQYKAGCGALDSAKQYMDENAAVFSEIKEKIASTGKEAKEVTDGIDSTKASIVEANAALDEHCNQKDAATATIRTLDSQIGKLQSQLNDETLDDSAEADIRAQIAELQKQKADLQAQIVQLGDQILLDEEKIRELHASLDGLYGQLEQLVSTNDSLSQNEKEIYLVSVQNERKLAQIEQDVETAQAQMTYWDIRVDELQDEYELALEQEKEAETEQSELIPPGVSVDEVEDTSPTDLPGLAEPVVDADSIQTTEDGYTALVDGKETKISINKSQDKYSYTVEKDGDAINFDVDFDEGETVEAQDCVLKFDGYTKGVYSKNTDAFNAAIEAGNNDFEIDGVRYKLRLVSDNGGQHVYKITKSLIHEFHDFEEN